MTKDSTTLGFGLCYQGASNHNHGNETNCRGKLQLAHNKGKISLLLLWWIKGRLNASPCITHFTGVSRYSLVYDGPSSKVIYRKSISQIEPFGLFLPFPTIYPTNNMGEENIYIPRHRKRLRELPKKLKDTKRHGPDMTTRLRPCNKRTTILVLLGIKVVHMSR